MSLMRFTLFLLAATAAFSAEPTTTPIDNDQVKVLKVTQDPHAKTRLHQHKINRVMIYLQAGRQTIEQEDGKKVKHGNGVHEAYESHMLSHAVELLEGLNSRLDITAAHLGTHGQPGNIRFHAEEKCRHP